MTTHISQSLTGVMTAEDRFPDIHYNYHRPHGTAGGRPPASRLQSGGTNVVASYS
ncbi:hypothetical protein GCM10017776_24890 [Streptomyces griseoluteus]|nr:hypothetical protein GCM10017776_24890 [Streptomyces griseoluteus]